jgi:hypothetical protein
VGDLKAELNGSQRFIQNGKPIFEDDMVDLSSVNPDSLTLSRST